MRIVALEHEVLERERKQVADVWIRSIFGNGRGERVNCSRACSR
jgi:hypothetical protein